MEDTCSAWHQFRLGTARFSPGTCTLLHRRPGSGLDAMLPWRPSWTLPRHRQLLSKDLQALPWVSIARRACHLLRSFQHWCPQLLVWLHTLVELCLLPLTSLHVRCLLPDLWPLPEASMTRGAGGPLSLLPRWRPYRPGWPLFPVGLHPFTQALRHVPCHDGTSRLTFLAPLSDTWPEPRTASDVFNLPMRFFCLRLHLALRCSCLPLPLQKRRLSLGTGTSEVLPHLPCPPGRTVHRRRRTSTKTSRPCWPVWRIPSCSRLKACWVSLHPSLLWALLSSRTWVPLRCGSWVPLWTERCYGLGLRPDQREREVAPGWGAREVVHQ